MWVQWYATVLRQDAFAAERHRGRPGRTALWRHQIRRPSNRDDRYKITQMTWCESKDDWYRLLGRSRDDRVPPPQRRPIPDPDHLHLAR